MIVRDEKIIIYHSVKRWKVLFYSVDSLPPKMEEYDQQWERDAWVRLSTDSFVVASIFFIELSFLVDENFLHSPIVTKHSVKGTLFLAFVVSALLNQFVSCHSSSCFALQRYELAIDSTNIITNLLNEQQNYQLYWSFPLYK